MSQLLYAPAQYFTTNLATSGGINDTQTTGIILNELTGISSDLLDKPSVIALSFNLDERGILDTSIVEFIEYSSINPNTKELVGVVRGIDGYPAKAHNFGANVAFVISKSHINRLCDNFNPHGLISNDVGNALVTSQNDQKLFVPTSTGVSTPNTVTIDSNNTANINYPADKAQNKSKTYIVTQNENTTYNITLDDGDIIALTVTIGTANKTITLKDANTTTITPSSAGSDFNYKSGSVNDVIIWRIGLAYYAVNGVVVEGV